MKSIFTIISILFFTQSSLIAQTSKDLKIGNKAPDFEFRYATKESIASKPLRLSDIIGKSKIILAFYPADWSTGCTKEICTFRDNFSLLSKLNAEVLGISGDYISSHHEWAKQQQLQFKLISDHKHQIAKLYNSYDEEKGYNKRTVYVIDEDGNILYVDLNYTVSDERSFDKLKRALEGLK